MTETTTPQRTPQMTIDKRIAALQKGYLANRSDSIAALARLRRGVGKPPGSVQDILEHTLAPEFVFGWHKDEPSRAETAAHHAMTLYALHQQSQSRGMHQPGKRLGNAIRRLASGSTVEPSHPIARRFAMLGTADSLDELIQHLRGVVQLLRASGIPIDYGLLAAQLMSWQAPRGPAGIRLIWGRDFHLSKPDAKDGSE
jgi:CRISPR system Cascade subunit CasB